MSEPAKRPPTTVYLYELAWILPSIAIPIGMLAALTVTAFGAGIHLPSMAGRVSPTQVGQAAPLDNPGVRQTGPGHSEVVMPSQICPTGHPGSARQPGMHCKPSQIEPEAHCSSVRQPNSQRRSSA